MKRIFIVTANFYAGEALADMIKQHATSDALCVSGVYRTYNLPSLKKGDIVISDGTCKDMDGYLQAVGVFFSPHRQARKAGAKHIGVLNLAWSRRYIFTRLRMLGVVTLRPSGHIVKASQESL